ncbi:hypothetical protein CSB45_00255 [candidate division KSB3 bacterium]|uniref:Glycosyl transferase family 1 n=1 Tax=candidate division KSB3 bacterium TaxID=2044937 RepID=A0A2G6EEW5_9BACT|nr:MAG: hypothetical protein CSB45_00255 [candidate division KSB3 bacterium]PIE28376.1 MAG: hypothetical protein CSA57_14105 [candidate division KSB3 bacterium]
MNVCLITGIFPPDIGGPASYVSRLARALQGESHKVVVVTLGDHPPDAPFPVWQVSRKLPLPLRILKLFCVLVQKGWSADVWYINGLELPAVLAGKLLRKALVMKVVGDYAWERAMNTGLTSDAIDKFQHTRQAWKVELHKALRTCCARQAETVITPSQYLKTLVCGWGVPDERVHVIYNAVEPCSAELPSKTEIRNQLGFSADDLVLMTTGRLVAWKGIDQLLQLLPHFGDAVKLLIVGDGPEKNRLTALAHDLKITQRVRFLGQVSREQGFAYMKASEAFVLNSAYEGFSHVLLEAMMLGVPVLTTSVCGNPELVTHQENGLLFPQGDLAAMKEQITSVLSDSALRERLTRGASCMILQTSWERLLRETLNVLCRFSRSTL